MSDEPTRTLFHPFAAGLIGPPPAGSRVLVLDAGPGFRLPEGFAARPALVQDMRSEFLALAAEGHDVAPAAEGGGYAMALVLLGRSRGRNELRLAEALRRTLPGGRIVVAGANTDGAQSLAKRSAALLPLEGRLSKHHGVVFWMARPREAEAAIRILEEANPPRIVEGGFETAPGMFSHDGVDPGSRLLGESLPDGLVGRAADFGAGWGYLAARLAARAPEITSVDLFEASHSACEAARRNLARLAPGLPARVFWHDLAGEAVEGRYDVIVMNPPFHRGRGAEPAIGEGMIRAAFAALAPRGVLHLVANLGLRYERTLSSLFTASGEVRRDASFKILWARR